MKIAICLYGNVGDTKDQGIRVPATGGKPGANALTPVESYKEAFKTTGWTNPKRAFAGLKKHVMDRHDTDVFVHSWSVDHKQQILDLYEPKAYKIERQCQFHIDLAIFGITNDTDIDTWNMSEDTKRSYKYLLPSRKNVKTIVKELPGFAFRAKSRWWSTQKAVELKTDYEADTGKYDFVMLTRFDNIFLKPIPFEKLKNGKLYGSRRTGRPDEAHALFDYWFIADSASMAKFGYLYNNMHKYSIRPPFACREHAKRVLGEDSIEYLFEHGRDYHLARHLN